MNEFDQRRNGFLLVYSILSYCLCLTGAIVKLLVTPFISIKPSISKPIFYNLFIVYRKVFSDYFFTVVYLELFDLLD